MYNPAPHVPQGKDQVSALLGWAVGPGQGGTFSEPWPRLYDGRLGLSTAGVVVVTAPVPGAAAQKSPPGGKVLPRPHRQPRRDTLCAPRATAGTLATQAGPPKTGRRDALAPGSYTPRGQCCAAGRSWPGWGLPHPATWQVTVRSWGRGPGGGRALTLVYVLKLRRISQPQSWYLRSPVRRYR